MNSLTESVRESFNCDDIRVHKGVIQVYWHMNSLGPWVSADGGPMYGETAKARTHRIADRILANRDMLPMEIMENPVIVGEMNPDGAFIAHITWKERA